jgi:type IV pilus assembly protein PilV
MNTPAMHGSRQASRGVTLIEVLVALVVLSIGLLGVCALIINSVRSNDSADMRSKAAILANAMVDDMRANSTAAVAGAYNGTFSVSQAPNSGNVIAQSDLTNWVAALNATGSSGLPSGQGTIATQSKPNTNATFTQVTVTVQWDDTRGAAAFEGCTTPPCNGTLTVNAYIP